MSADTSTTHSYNCKTTLFGEQYTKVLPEGP